MKTANGRKMMFASTPPFLGGLSRGIGAVKKWWVFHLLNTTSIIKTHIFYHFLLKPIHYLTPETHGDKHQNITYNFQKLVRHIWKPLREKFLFLKHSVVMVTVMESVQCINTCGLFWNGKWFNLLEFYFLSPTFGLSVHRRLTLCPRLDDRLNLSALL